MTAADSIHAVITDDDGIGSEGLRMLARAAVRAGTVGAAMTAAAYGVRAAAFSLDAREGADGCQWGPAGDVAGEILPALGDIPPGVVLNVNIPNAPRDRISGIRRARLAAAGAVEL